MKDYKKGFNSAFERIPLGDIPRVREELKAILKIKSNVSFWNFRYGKQVPKADIAERIIAYFKSKGISDVYE